MNALELFRLGVDLDYTDIAKLLNTTEAEVERQIHRLRKQEWEPARVPKTEEQKRAEKQAYNARMRQQLREIREAHR